MRSALQCGNAVLAFVLAAHAINNGFVVNLDKTDASTFMDTCNIIHHRHEAVWQRIR
jgi:hypothetical protein